MDFLFCMQHVADKVMNENSGTFALGTWQARRWQWKKDMIDERIKGLKDPSISPPPPNASPEKWADCHFRRIEVKGRFLNSQTFYVGPRSAPSLHASGTGLMSASNPQTGYFMITPFVPTSADFDPLLVNRGWIPTSLKKQMQEVSDSPEQYSIICVPRPGEKQSMFITNDPVKGNWLSMNVAEMARHTGLDRTAPVICDLIGPCCLRAQPCIAAS
jgi:surfeit locus 1 family protein